MGNRGDPPPEDREENREAETTFNHPDDDREEETNELEWEYPSDDRDEGTSKVRWKDDRENYNEFRKNLNKRIAAEERKKTGNKKEILFDLGYKLRKGDGKKSAELFNRLKLTVSEKTGEPNGMKLDNVKIIILKNRKYTFSENARFRFKIDEFRILAEQARLEHDKTAVSDIEEVVPDIPVDDGHASSILSNSREKIGEEISDREDGIAASLTGQELREFAGLLDPKGQTVEEKINALKVIEDIFQDRANEVEGDPGKEPLYEFVVEVAKLKADQLRLEANLKPESETAQNILAEETENNPLTRFERFKKWARENVGGISVFAISVAGIITTIVMGMKTVVVGGAKAASKFGKFLAKLAEKAGPVLGALLNLAAGLLKLGAKGISFLAENLWILAVMIAYALWKKAKGNK